MPPIEIAALLGTFTVVFTALCGPLSRLKLPAGGVPRRRPDRPGPSRTDVPPSSVALTERDGPGPTTSHATEVTL